MHPIADTVRNSLNFYRMQENAEIVDRAVLTGPAVTIPGFAARALRAAPDARRVGRRRRPSDGADLGRLTVAAGLAVDATP